MDNPRMPWSLIGISDEARKAVRIAAAENDQTIGQWLNNRILSAATKSNPVNEPTSSNNLGPTGTARAVLLRMDKTLSDAELYSTQEIESYRVALEQITQRVYDLEDIDNTE